MGAQDPGGLLPLDGPHDTREREALIAAGRLDPTSSGPPISGGLAHSSSGPDSTDAPDSRVGRAIFGGRPDLPPGPAPVGTPDPRAPAGVSNASSLASGPE